MAYGYHIKNLQINGVPAPYGVLNERDARAAAGIMLLVGLFAFVNALLLMNLLPLTIVVFAFFLEFSIRVFKPDYAPFYALGKLLVRKQAPEYSGAIQKRFAWSLGLAMALSMIVVSVLLNIRGAAPLSICITCLALLWAESALGVCIGCKCYYGLQQIGIVKKPQVAPACPGGLCPIGK